MVELKFSRKEEKNICSICHKEGHNKRKHGPGTNGVSDIHARTQSAQQQIEAPTARLKKLPVR